MMTSVVRCLVAVAMLIGQLKGEIEFEGFDGLPRGRPAAGSIEEFLRRELVAYLASDHGKKALRESGFLEGLELKSVCLSEEEMIDATKFGLITPCAHIKLKFSGSIEGKKFSQTFWAAPTMVKRQETGEWTWAGQGPMRFLLIFEEPR